MTEFYLVTGFLGAGKTSFLKSFLPKLQDKEIQLIINEFGNTGVDGSLLLDKNKHLEEICGGSIFCSCKLDRFEEAMNNCLKTKADAIIVEASGLSDPTNIRKILDDYENEGELHYRGCICLVDAARFHKVLETARVCKKQLMVADVILINKTDLVTKEQIEKLEASIKVHAPFALVHYSQFGKVDFNIEDLEVVAAPSLEMLEHNADLTLQKMSIEIDENMTLYQLEHFLKQFAEDTARIKGYVFLKECGMLLVDCVGTMISIKKTETQDVDLSLNVLATKGQNMRKSLKSAIALYPNVTYIKK